MKVKNTAAAQKIKILQKIVKQKNMCTSFIRCLEVDDKEDLKTKEVSENHAEPNHHKR